MPIIKNKWGTGMLRSQMRSLRGVVQDLPVSGFVLKPKMRRLLRVVFWLISSRKLLAKFFLSFLHSALSWSGRGMRALVRIKNSATQCLFFFDRKTAGEKGEKTKLAFFSMFPHPNPSPGGRGDISAFFSMLPHPKPFPWGRGDKSLCRTAGRQVHLKAIPEGSRGNECYGAAAAPCM